MINMKQVVALIKLSVERLAGVEDRTIAACSVYEVTNECKFLKYS